MKIAQAQNPAPPAEAASPESIKNVALKFVNNLSSHVSDTGAEFTAETDNAELNAKELTSLQSLLRFLETNGISISGHPLALRPDQHSDKGNDKLYFKYPNTNEPQFYVYKDGVIKYLQDLQSQAGEKTPRGRMLRMYVSALIKSANTELGIIIPSTSDLEDAKNALNGIVKDRLDMVVDTLATQNPFAKNGGISVMKADLASRESFHGWMQKNNIKVDLGKGAVDLSDMTREHVQAAARILNARANRLLDVTNSESSKIYVQLTKALLDSMGAAPAAEQGANQNVSYQDPSNSTGVVTTSGAITDKGVGAMIKIDLPLIMDEIDVDRIGAFAEAFKNIYPAATTNVFSTLQKLSSTYPGLKNQDLNISNFDEISKFILNNGGRGSAAEYIYELGNLLQSTQKMLQALSAMLLKSGNDFSLNYKKQIDDQLQNVYRNNTYGLRKFQGQYQAHLNEIATQTRNNQTWRQ